MKVPLEGHVSVCVQLNLKQQNSSSKIKVSGPTCWWTERILGFCLQSRWKVRGSSLCPREPVCTVREKEEGEKTFQTHNPLKLQRS